MILAAGSFTSYYVYTRQRIAQFNSDGTLDTAAFSGGYGANSTIYSMAPSSSSAIYIAGDFTAVGPGSTSRNRVARITYGGACDTSFDPGSGANSSVYAILETPEGVYIGGAFSSFNGVSSRYRVGRLTVAGAWDTGFNPSPNTSNGAIYALARQSNGKLLIGGSFTTFNGATAYRLERLNVNGTLDASWYRSGGVDNTIYATATDASAKILIGGSFQNFETTTLNRIARLNGD